MSETYKIDAEKLKAELNKRGLTQKQASTELGFSKNFISNFVNRGEIKKPWATLLEKSYNIRLEDYVIEEKETVVANAAIDYNELYKTIRSAVYEAVKKAWSE